MKRKRYLCAVIILVLLAIFLVVFVWFAFFQKEVIYISS